MAMSSVAVFEMFLSILRWSNVTCRIHYVMSLVIFSLMSIGFMSPVDFKKRPCRPVAFKGQGPQSLSTHSVGPRLDQTCSPNVQLNTAKVHVLLH